MIAPSQPTSNAAARSVQRRYAFLDDLVAEVPPGAVRRAAATIAIVSVVGDPTDRSHPLDVLVAVVGFDADAGRGAEIVGDGHRLRVMIGDHSPRQLSDLFGISVIAHTRHDRNSTPVENQRPPIRRLSRFPSPFHPNLSFHICY